MLEIIDYERVAIERPYTLPTVAWRVTLEYTSPELAAPVVGVFNVHMGPGYASGPGSADDIFCLLLELAEDEYLDVREMASCFLDYEPEEHTRRERAQALSDARALRELGRRIADALAPILEAMGPQYPD